MPADDAPPIQYAAQRYDPAVPVDLIEPDPANPNEGDVGAIVEAIDELGFYGAVYLRPIEGDRYMLIAGEHRWRAVIARNGTSIPALINTEVDHRNALRMLVGDNRIARLGRDDPRKLVPVLADLSGDDTGLTGTGFDLDDLDDLVHQMTADDDVDPGELFGKSLPERMEGYTGATQRMIVLPYARHVHEWMVHQLDDLVRVLGKSSYAEAILHLVADATGEPAP